MRQIEYKDYETHCKSNFHIMRETGAFVIIMVTGAHVLAKLFFLAAKAQLNTCICVASVCLSVVKTEFLPVYTPLHVMFRLCAFLLYM